MNNSFDDLYTAVYAILDDAKTDHRLVKLYKGSHLSPDPHDSVLAFGEFFARRRRGLVGFACSRMNTDGQPTIADLNTFDETFQPRLPMRRVFEHLADCTGRPGEPADRLLGYLATRVHALGRYRGGSTGFDEESRAVASAHFAALGVPSSPDEVVVSCGGAKGVFLAFCAALMCDRSFDELHCRGGVMLAPAGYYQSLRLIPAIFGGHIDVICELTGSSVARWLADTAGRSGRCVYVPLVNNATGDVLTADRAKEIGAAVVAHNATNTGNPVFVLGDDVYAGSYLDPQADALPIGAAPGMDQWTVSVVSPSKTYALPTSRVAFATTSDPAMLAALKHYRTVFAHGRTPQAAELTAAAALAFTPASWIDEWNRRYRARFAELAGRLDEINREVGWPVVRVQAPQGGWYVPLRVDRDAFPVPVTSSVDAFAILLHYGGEQVETGLGVLPGELFGQRLQTTDRDVTLRATVAVAEPDLVAFASRLRDVIRVLDGPAGAHVARQALRRARQVANVDRILEHVRY